jgi:hypothetical protein
MARLEREAQPLQARQLLEYQAVTWAAGVGSLPAEGLPADAKSLLHDRPDELTAVEKDFLNKSELFSAQRRDAASAVDKRSRRLVWIGAAATLAFVAMSVWGLKLWRGAGPPPGASEQAVRLEKVADNGQAVPAGGYRNFAVRAVTSSGKPAVAAKVGWRTDGCGRRAFVGETDGNGISSATNMCALSSGTYRQEAVLVDASTPSGFTEAVTAQGTPVTFIFVAEPPPLDRREYSDGTYTEQGMKACPAGFAVGGANLEENRFLCRRVASPKDAENQETLVDTATVRAGARSCPVGMYLRGIHVQRKLLLCSGPPGAKAVTEYDDGPAKVTQDYGMHVCPSTAESYSVLTGLGLDNNHFRCAAVDPLGWTARLK